MSTQNYFILTPSQRTEAMTFNTNGFEVDPRAVDNASPGVGLNLNDNATDYQPVDPVTLTGTYVCPKRVVDDGNYPLGLKTFLLTLPWALLENETIFAPVE